MAAILPKVAQGAANSLLRRAGNYSQKKSESNSKPKVPQGQGGQAMFRFLGDVGASVGGATPPGLGAPRGDDEDPLLLWQGVSLTYRGVPTLANCSGYVTRGEFVCVLGPGSGSDRVALLDVLSGRAVSGSIEGHFAYDGRRFTKEHLLELSTYVPQETSFLAHATCEEAIYFVAKLRLPRETTEADVARRCGESLKTTELDGCRDEFVGGSLGGGRVVVGLSAVQRRQLSIAVGLVAQPRLMFAENPTRGLDAAAALRFVRLVGALCDGGLAAVCAVNLVNTKLHAVRERVHVVAENAPLPSKATEAHFEQVLKSYERALLQHGCSIDEIRAISERADINLDGDSVITPKRTISDSELAGAARPPPAAATEAPPDLAPSYVPYTPIDDAPGDVPPLEDAYDESGLLAPAPTPPGFRYDVGDEVNI